MTQVRPGNAEFKPQCATHIKEHFCHKLCIWKNRAKCSLPSLTFQSILLISAFNNLLVSSNKPRAILLLLGRQGCWVIW